MTSEGSLTGGFRPIAFAVVAAAVAAAWSAPSPARAQDLEPRAYANTPVGIQIVY